MSGSADVIIIGAGHNGLVTAFYLAKAGLRPLILESRDATGGCVANETFRARLPGAAGQQHRAAPTVGRARHGDRACSDVHPSGSAAGRARR